MKKKQFSEVGAVPLLILLGVVGIIAALVILTTAPFKNGLLSSLNSKKSSFASGFTNFGLSFNPSATANDTLEGVDFGTTMPGLGSTFTVEAFVNYVGNTSTYDLVLGRQNWGQQDWVLSIDGGVPFGSITYDGDHANTNGQQRNLTGGAALSTFTWHHLALEGTGTEFRLYVDGVLKSSTPQTGPIFNSGNTVNVFMGRKENPTQSAVLHGVVDEARISNVARYTSNFTPTTTPFITDANTVALWHLDEGTGSTVNDSSGHNYKGTVQQTPRWVLGNPALAVASPSPSSGGVSNPINPTPSPSKVGDFDGNGKIDIFDYNTLLTNFGHTGSGVVGDITGPSGVPDGVVSIYDYNLLLTNFGQ